MASAFLGNASGGSRAIRLSSFLTRQSANLATLEPRDTLGNPAGGRQSAEVGWIERRVPFDDVDVAVDDDRVDRRHMLKCALQSPFDSVAADFLDADHQIAGIERVAVHL